MEAIKPNFNFKIMGEIFLSPEDLQVLTLLYQPIMGVDAFSLYVTFSSLSKIPTQKNNFALQKNNFVMQKHHLLLQMLGGSMERLLEARKRLEAMGLLDVYESENEVTYVLKSPLTIKQFFCDAIMRAFLYVKVGVQDFNHLKQMLVVDDVTPIGEKITKRFDEVFDVRPLGRLEQNSQISWDAKPRKQGVEIASVFDTNVLMMILVKKGISQEIITADLIKTLNEFAFLYKFDVHELARLVFDASTPDGTVDMIKMKDLARTQYQLISKGVHVQVVIKEGEEENQTLAPKTLDDDDIVSFLEQSPVEFLRFKSAGKPPVPADVKLVEWLYADQKMPAGVVNVLVDYVLEHTGGSLPKQMIEKIAGQWQRQGIDTTQAAMERVLATIRKSVNYQKEKARPIGTSSSQQIKKATRVEPIPEWLGKDYSQSEEDVEAKKRIEQMMRSHGYLGGGRDEEVK